MRIRVDLSLLLACGSVIYCAVLWKGQKSLVYSQIPLDVSLDQAHGVSVATTGTSVETPRSLAASNRGAAEKIKSMPQALSEFKESAKSFSNRQAAEQPKAEPELVPEEKDENADNGRQGRPKPLFKKSAAAGATKELAFVNDPGDDRPPYDSIVDESGAITGNTENVLHFAVIGFGKCGTTSMIASLDEHPDLVTYPHEIYDLMQRRPENLIRRIYMLPVGKPKRGYKSPVDLSLVHTMEYFRLYFYKTKLIVGIRHPVKWFESLYNFRIQNLKPNVNHSEFPRPNEVIGRCYPQARNTCTYKGEFAIFIRNLGKTLATHNPINNETGEYELTELEIEMYNGAQMTEWPNIQEVVPNPIFLFEIGQLADKNETRSAHFRQDLAHFLDLESPLNPFSHSRPGREWTDAELQKMKNEMKIDICDDEHIPVRSELMRMARGASMWIRYYFLDPATMASSGIHVSSADYLHSLLKDWMKDPCGGDATKEAGRSLVQAMMEELKDKNAQPEDADIMESLLTE